MIWLAVGILLIGLALLAWFVRGRRRGASPMCRGCGYDLTGHWPAEPTCSQCGKALAPVCPECGANLLGRRAVRHGARSRAMGLGAAGVMVSVVGLLMVSAIVWGRLTRYDWNAAKPSFWLVGEARAGDADALVELIDRFKDGELNQAHVVLLVDQALAAQGRGDPAWFDALGEVFGTALARGLVTEGQLRQFTRQMYELEVLHPSVVRRGEAWSGATQVRSLRLPPGSWTVMYDVRRYEIGDQVFFDRAQPNILSRTGPRTARAVFRWHPAEFPRLSPVTLEPGVHPFKVTYIVAFQDTTATPAREVLEQVVYEGEIEVVDHDEPLVPVIADESLRASIERVVASRDVRIFEDARRGIHTWTGIDVREPPVDLAFDVFVRQGDREWPVGSIAAHKDTTGVHSFGESPYGLEGFDLEGTVVDVILRSSRRTWEAKGMRATEGIWGGELVLEDVPVAVQP